MRRGFLYLVANMDRFTRKVLAWRISNTLKADFCVEALNEAVHKFGAPNAHTLPMAVNRPPWSTSTPSKPISRCRL